MEVIGFRDTSPASVILRHIQRCGQATIKELEHVLGVSTTAVREHLAQLHVNGLVETSTMRSGPGRPRLVYTLTDKAQQLFPRHYDVLIDLILRELIAEQGVEQVHRLLQRVGERLTSDYTGSIQASDLQGRLDELCHTLASKGIPADVAAEVESGAAHITLHSCPYHGVAHSHAAVCHMEKQMFEHVLGQELRLEHSIREGSHNCRFSVEREQEPSA
jgi:predicted ArsR family transcriptional regulator